MSKLTDVFCTYTGGGIYICTARLDATTWLMTDFESYGTYDVPYDDIEEKYDCDYDSHWKDAPALLPTWAEVLDAVMKSYRSGVSRNMDPNEVRLQITRNHPDIRVRIDFDDSHIDSHSVRMETINSFIEIFEDFLDEKGIVIPNPEKDEDPNASNIYGTDYGTLSDQIEQLLVQLGMLDEEEEEE